MKHRTLGQNFLVNRTAARAIVQHFDARENDLIVEVGPGQGALTKHLSARSPMLCAVEKDARLFGALSQTFKHDRNVRIINSDILKHDFLHFCSVAGFTGTKIRIIGNLPYSISKPLLMKIFTERKRIKDFMVMLQREVAAKLLAGPGSKIYSPLSVLFALTARIEKIMELSPRSFSPAPQVYSTVVHGRFLRQAAFTAREEEMVKKVLSALFAQRRKTIRNTLTLLLGDTARSANVIGSCELNQDMRAEMLSPHDVVRIARIIRMKAYDVLL